MYAADYMERVVVRPGEVADQVLDGCLRVPRFDAIACRGLSGALVASIVAAKLDKPLVVVRKKIEGTHSSYGIEQGVAGPFRYVIVDDLIDKGGTVRAIIEKIKEREEDAVCVGIILYAQDKAESSIYAKAADIDGVRIVRVHSYPTKRRVVKTRIPDPDRVPTRPSARPYLEQRPLPYAARVLPGDIVPLTPTGEPVLLEYRQVPVDRVPMMDCPF